MTNDAKLGLVLGVCLVVAVAALFFRRDAADGPLDGGRPPASVVHPSAGPASHAAVARNAIQAASNRAEKTEESHAQ